MSSKSARWEYLQALAQFERACTDFAAGMSSVLDPEPQQPAQPPAPAPLLEGLGPRKPAKRAQRKGPGSSERHPRRA